MTLIKTLLAPAAAMAILAGSANAQFVVETKADNAPKAKNVSKQSIVVTDDDGSTYKIVLVDDKLEGAWIDGDKVGHDQIIRADNMIKLVGEDGQVIHTFKVKGPQALVKPTAPDAPAVQFFSDAGGGNVQATNAWTAKVAMDAPPVMLGINLSEPGEALRAQLGLGDLEAILIDGVIDGLPAKKAGIKKFDVIVSLDGSKGASSESLSKVMSKKSAGDPMEIVLMRGGEKIKIVAKLAAYDAAALGAEPTIIYDDDPNFPGWTEKDQDGKLKMWVERNDQMAKDRAIEELEMAREAVDRSRAMNEEMKRKIESAMREAERRVLELRDGQLFLRERDAAGQKIDELRLLEHLDQLENRFDRHMPGLQSELDARLDAMERRFNEIEHELDARLESLGGRMERLADLMEHLADRLERFAEREDD